MNLMRRLRGVAGSMSIWAVVFAAIGVVGSIPVSLIYRLPPLASGQFARVLVATIVRWGLAGAVMGLAFAAAVMLAERSRTRTTLSLRRFTTWGFLAGAIVPVGLAIVYELTGRSSPGFDLRAGGESMHQPYNKR